MRGSTVAALLALSLTLQTDAQAQARRARSVELGLLTQFEESEATLLVGYRTSSLKKGVGFDFSIGTLPEGFFESLFIALAHFDLTVPVAVGTRSWLLPRAGVSAIVAAGELIFDEPGFGAAPGFNIGVGLLGRMGERNGLRLDLTHMLLIGDDDVGVTAVTIGYAWVK
jgi:hypothetical protein